jgi:Zn-dependent protease with chaperone function
VFPGLLAGFALLVSSVPLHAVPRTQAQLDRKAGRQLAVEDSHAAGLQERAPVPAPAGARLGPTLCWIAAAWVFGLLALLAAGAGLSRAVKRVAEELPSTDASGHGRGAPALLRRAYTLVLWLACAYYYVSMPLVSAGVTLAGCAVVYAGFAAGRIPVKLALFVVVVTLATLWSMLKSVFVRAKDEDPGQRLDLRAHPKLRFLLDEVARRVGTRPVQNVYLTPGTDVAVMERGSMFGQLRGSAERCLILGVGVLDGLRLGPFKAVLAHEYGHFSNRDTAGGGVAIGVRRSLVAMAQCLSENGAGAWYNPAWLFLNAFFRVFLRISQGASRLQEILADRWAAFTYGSDAFEEGLRHVIERSVRFDARAHATLSEIVARQQPLANLYSHVPTSPMAEDQLAKAVAEALDRPPSVYDSHPSPAERTRWVRALAAKGGAASPDDAAPAWSLFSDRDWIERQMTRHVKALVLRSQGIRIAG